MTVTYYRSVLARDVVLYPDWYDDGQRDEKPFAMGNPDQFIALLEISEESETKRAARKYLERQHRENCDVRRK